MLDEFRNISILNHFLQNVTCSMWVKENIDNIIPLNPSKKHMSHRVFPYMQPAPGLKRFKHAA